jgi:hypothetical protein
MLALPVVVGDILAAKLAAILATAAATIMPMFLVDAVVILTLRAESMAYVIGGLFLLVTTLVASVSLSLVMSLLARDQRSATQLGGMLAVPPLLLTGLCVVFVPGLGRFVVLGLLMLALGCGALYGGLRFLTAERYVS